MLMNAVKPTYEELLKKINKLETENKFLKSTPKSQVFQRNNTIFQTSSDAIIVVDNKGIVCDWNKAAVNLFGYEKEEIIGQHVKTIHAPEDFAAFGKVMQQIQEGIPIQNLELNCITKEGKTIRILESICSVTDENGKLIEIIGIAKDITEHRASVQKLLDSEERYRKVLEFLPVGVIMRKADGEIVYANREMAKVFGVESSEQLIGLISWDFTTPNSVEKIKEFAQKIFMENLQSDTHELLMQKFDGTEITVLVRAMPSYFKGNKVALIVMADINAWKEAEKALHDSQLNLNAVLENTPDLVLSLDNNYNILTINDSGKKVFKQTLDIELDIGKNIIELLPMEYKELWKSRYDKALHGEQYVIEDKYEFNGKPFISEVMFNPIWMNGLIHGVSVFSRNITPAKLTEKALKNSEQFLDAIVEFLPVGIGVGDTQGNIIKFNKTFFDIFGYTHEEAQTLEQHLKLAYPDDNYRNEILADFAIEMQNLDPVTKQIPAKEYKATSKSGEVKDIEVTIKYINDTSLATYVDISKRKQDEEALRASEQFLDEIIELLPVGVGVANIGGTITKLNKKIYEMFGYTIKDTPTLDDWFEILFPDKAVYEKAYALFRKDMSNSIAEGKEAPLREYPMTCKNGELKNIEVGFKVFSDKAMATFVDVTERRKVEDDLIKSKEKAEESDRLKSIFLANMSHEIRTPMNGILGFAELLKAPELTGIQKAKYIKLIDASGKRMLNIINDLIDISKIEAGQVELNCEDIQVKEILEDLYAFFKPLADNQSIVLNLVVNQKKEDCTMHADKDRITQVLTNLLQNALKFTDEGFVSFGCKKSEKAFEFFVSDSGKGIPEADLETIFDRFNQVEDGFSKGYDGAGLGLSISKGLIEKHNGKMWVKSTLGKGSSFYFNIPFK